MTADAPGEVVFRMPPPHLPLRRVRSTLLVASYRMVQRMGREREYLAALPTRHHSAITGAVAGTWVEADAAVAHYETCESFGLSNEEQVDIGRTVGEHIRGTLFGTIVSLSKEIGATPWMVWPPLPRLWPRLFDGSWISITKLGPKECRLDIRGLPLIDIRYFRNAIRGQVMGTVDLFCTRTYAHSRAGQLAPGSHSLRVQWA